MSHTKQKYTSNINVIVLESTAYSTFCTLNVLQIRYSEEDDHFFWYCFTVSTHKRIGLFLTCALITKGISTTPL